MSPEYAAEWVRKAESDRTTAEVCLKLSRRKRDQAEISCFHAQQCAEKYLKALLAQAGRAVPRIHDLLKLGEMSAERRMRLAPKDLYLLNAYAVEVRYPGSTVSPDEARAAYAAMERIRSACRRALGLR
jgi:HEPN domain-containing protein